MKPATQKKEIPRPLLTIAPNGAPTHDAIAFCAYSLWEQQGRPQNREVEIWLQAETQLRQTQNQH